MKLIAISLCRDGNAARAEANAKVKEAQDATAKAAQVAQLHLVQFSYPSCCKFDTMTGIPLLGCMLRQKCCNAATDAVHMHLQLTLPASIIVLLLECLAGLVVAHDLAPINTSAYTRLVFQTLLPCSQM